MILKKLLKFIPLIVVPGKQITQASIDIIISFKKFVLKNGK
jgi:hypothetical protein